MTDAQPPATIDPASRESLEFLGAMADTALDTMKPALRAAVLKIAQGHINALAIALTPRPGPPVATDHG